MKPNDCKSIRCEIDQSELGQELRSHVVAHIDECRSCREFYESDNKLRQLVASMPAVEAPADFDFRLSARIAQTSARRLSPVNFSFALPSAVVAALALVVAGVFIFRSPQPANNAPIALKSPDVAVPAATQATPALVNHEQASINSSFDDNNRKPSIARTHKSVPKGTEFADQRGRIVNRDFSSMSAPIVKNEQPGLRIQPQLVFPLQTITVSVDDDKGVSRTISFPTVSFGSQRVLAGNGSAFQTPTRTNW